MKLLILAAMLISCESSLQCVDGIMYNCGHNKSNDCRIMYESGTTDKTVKCIERVK